MTYHNGFGTTFLEDLKSRCDIVQVISKYLPLEKKGRNYWGSCPFHHEKTPSFSVNPESQFYHCFGCGVSGDVIKFVEEMESVDFLGAVGLLCEQAGMKMPEFRGRDAARIEEEKRKKDRLLNLVKDAANFYFTCLRRPAGAEARAYLERRGVDGETVKKFALGFSPDTGSLPEYLRQKGYSREEMLASGAVGEKNGYLFDNLAGRLIFPIVNAFGEVIAFGGRVLGKTDFAKYKNTSDTELFNKRKTLYGVHLVKKTRQEKGLSAAVIVEGYMDTVALWQAGFDNVMASMGTSLTKDQARLIKRMCDVVYISYDGDAAGQKATLRGLDILSSVGITVRVVRLPEGRDPDEVIRDGGPEAYQKCLDSAIPLIDFKLLSLKSAYPVNNTEGRRKYAYEAVKLIAELPSRTEQEDCLKLIRKETGFTLEALTRDLENVREAGTQPPPAAPPRETVKEGGMETRAVRMILCRLLKGGGDPDDLSLLPGLGDPCYGALADYLKECWDEERNPMPSMAYECVPPEAHDEVSAILSADQSFSDPAEADRYCDEALRGFAAASLERDMAAVASRFEREEDLQERKKLAAQMGDLMRKLKKYK